MQTKEVSATPRESHRTVVNTRSPVRSRNLARRAFVDRRGFHRPTAVRLSLPSSIMWQQQHSLQRADPSRWSGGVPASLVTGSCLLTRRAPRCSGFRRTTSWASCRPPIQGWVSFQPLAIRLRTSHLTHCAATKTAATTGNAGLILSMALLGV